MVGGVYAALDGSVAQKTCLVFVRVDAVAVVVVGAAAVERRAVRPT